MGGVGWEGVRGRARCHCQSDGHVRDAQGARKEEGGKGAGCARCSRNVAAAVSRTWALSTRSSSPLTGHVAPVAPGTTPGGALHAPLPGSLHTSGNPLGNSEPRRSAYPCPSVTPTSLLCAHTKTRISASNHALPRSRKRCFWQNSWAAPLHVSVPPSHCAYRTACRPARPAASRATRRRCG